MNSDNCYRVWHEKGGWIMVYAKDEAGAKEAFYESIEGMIGHHLKICKCFGQHKPLDRNSVIQPTKIERVL